jgi:3D (Asp-Asp-Asp) domain-containing protein
MERRSNLFQEIILFMLLYFSSFDVTVTAYSPANVDPRWQGQARWTGQPPVVGVSAACPESWRMEWIYVQNYGWRRCEDTPRTGWYDDKPHIDLYLASHQEALNHGIQQLTVWKARD